LAEISADFEWSVLKLARPSCNIFWVDHNQRRKTTMPFIQVNVLKQPDIEKKKKLVAKLTDAVVEAYGVPREAVTVSLKEDEPENVGFGGILGVEKFKDES
jgi:4-oxalocrotonate tautomerase family enzyme